LSEHEQAWEKKLFSLRKYITLSPFPPCLPKLPRGEKAILLRFYSWQRSYLTLFQAVALERNDGSPATVLEQEKGCHGPLE
jgi:hypothetical protein